MGMARPEGVPERREPSDGRGWRDWPNRAGHSYLRARSPAFHYLVKGVAIGNVNLRAAHVPNRQRRELSAPPSTPGSEPKAEEFFGDRGEGPPLLCGKLLEFGELETVKHQSRSLHMKKHTNGRDICQTRRLSYAAVCLVEAS